MNHLTFFTLLTVFGLSAAKPALAQIYQSEETQSADTTEWDLRFQEDKAPTIELNPNQQKKLKGKKKRRRKKKVFYGVKTKKRVIYTEARRGRTIIEKFHILKKKNYQAPDPYVYEKYYFGVLEKSNGTRERTIMMRHDHDKEYGMPLHGTYEKFLFYHRSGKQVLLQKGIFYFGAKHGRWETFRNIDSLLVGKEKWYKGFPKDAEITYYDNEKTKVKEVIPYQLGEIQGTYLRFYESGRLAETGEYKYGKKVGVWMEFYDKDDKNYKKKTKYRDAKDVEELFAENFEPQVISEWDERGRRKMTESGEGENKDGDKPKKLKLKMPGSR